MKLRKIVLFIFLFFVGIIFCKALTNEEMYNNYNECYKVLKSLVYFDNNSVRDEYANNLDALWEESIKFKSTEDEDKYKPFNNGKSNSEIISILKEIYYTGYLNNGDVDNVDIHTRLQNVANLMITKLGITNENNFSDSYIASLRSQSSLTDMLSYTMSCMNSLATLAKKSDDYNALVDYTRGTFEPFCNYLKTHKGISYYIKTALKIIGYVALGLAVILGGIDFAEAILSNEDNALKKAFQKFIRRLIAAVLVFLAYLIVQLFLGLITKIPGIDESKIEICDELKIGSL